ncbi:kinase [Salinadaptatus halalkaliphilus]|uniref:Kinase n=1 Tax=Salinadaptatus halalkaliphilus TaxID=2419781 RepID=A0A4S3TVB3_9EURY|nr:AAA family ATPase [Salinadaptatus halalkaliphilus]THE66628.1 kinase [Salinadaptatus halalkaliphilus]
MDRPSLFVYCGLPGVGKSVASAYTAEKLAVKRYRSDEIRKELFPEPEYTAAETDATYEELLERARSELEAGSSVVLDATFRTRALRSRGATLARETDADRQFVHVTCDVDVVERRLAERTDSVSDADRRVYHLVKDSFESFERDHVEIDNSGSLEATYRQLDRAIVEPRLERDHRG